MSAVIEPGSEKRKQRRIAAPVVGGTEQGADGGLAFGFRIQVADVGHTLGSILGQPSIIPDYDTQSHEGASVRQRQS
jgi:hypothetical protein